MIMRILLVFSRNFETSYLLDIILEPLSLRPCTEKLRSEWIPLYNWFIVRKAVISYFSLLHLYIILLDLMKLY